MQRLIFSALLLPTAAGATLLFACGGSITTRDPPIGGEATSASPAPPPPPPPPPRSTTSSSVMTGPCSVEATDGAVRLFAYSARCTLHQGEEATFHIGYKIIEPVVVTQDPTNPPVGAVIAHRGSIAGQDKNSPEDARSSIYLMIGEGHAGGSEPHFCNCDPGPGPNYQPKTVTLLPQADEYPFEFLGKTWDGSSDYGAPLRDVFPIGHYKVHATFVFDNDHVLPVELPFEIVL